jgi:hypothetical protein
MSIAIKRRKVEGDHGSKKLIQEDYTVGWVCALLKE